MVPGHFHGLFAVGGHIAFHFPLLQQGFAIQLAERVVLDQQDRTSFEQSGWQRYRFPDRVGPVAFCLSPRQREHKTASFS